MITAFASNIVGHDIKEQQNGSPDFYKKTFVKVCKQQLSSLHVVANCLFLCLRDLKKKANALFAFKEVW